MSGWWYCRCKCRRFSDAFQRPDASNLAPKWNEVAGDWEISSNQLTVATANALTVANWSFPADIAAVATITGSAGDKARVCVHVTDEDNYLCAEIEFGATSSTVTLFQRDAGTDVFLASDTTTEVTSSDAGQLTVCIEGDRLSAVLADANGDKVAEQRYNFQVSLTPTSTVGLATGDTASTIAFDDFQAQRRTDDCQSCGNCPPPPYVDDFSTADPNWQISGGASEIAGGELLMKWLSGGSTVERCYSVPSGSGWVLTLQATLTEFPESLDDGQLTLETGEFGAAVELRAQFRFALPTTVLEYVAEDQAGSTTLSVTPAAGDVWKIVLTENGGAVDVDYYINGNLEASHSGAAFPSGNQNVVFTIGGTGTWQAKFDDFSIDAS